MTQSRSQAVFGSCGMCFFWNTSAPYRRPPFKLRSSCRIVRSWSIRGFVSSNLVPRIDKSHRRLDQEGNRGESGDRLG